MAMINMAMIEKAIREMDLIYGDLTEREYIKKLVQNMI